MTFVYCHSFGSYAALLRPHTVQLKIMMNSSKVMLSNQFRRRWQLNYCRHIRCSSNAARSFSVQQLLESHQSNDKSQNNFMRARLLGRSFFKMATTMHLAMTIDNASELHAQRESQFSKLAVPFRRDQQLETPSSSSFNLQHLPSTDAAALIRWKYEPAQEIQKYCRNDESLNSPKTMINHNLTLIGSYLIAHGEETTLQLIDWLHIPVMLHPDGIDAQIKSALINNSPEASQKLKTLLCGYDSFERILQYAFRDRSYLLQAVSHDTFKTNDLTDSYQKLALVGDAVLDYIITHHIYSDQRIFTATAMTKILAHILCNAVLSSTAARHQFHNYLRHISSTYQNEITRYARIQAKHYYQATNELNVMDEDSQRYTPSPYLADSFKAVAGAIFMDSSMTFPTVTNVYLRLMEQDIERTTESQPIISELMFSHPNAKFSKPLLIDADYQIYEVVVNIPDSGKYVGRGNCVAQARSAAAKNALQSLKCNSSQR